LVRLDLVQVPDRPGAELGERLGEVAAASPIGEGRLRDPEQLRDLVHAA
jgi:hypothetical protein